MDKFPPTGNPRMYTLSAMVIGYLLIDNFTANEQNAIGNWFMTVGQILECNSAFMQTMQERANTKNDSDIDTLKKTIELIKQKLEEL